jgi:uncharacterized protein
MKRPHQLVVGVADLLRRPGARKVVELDVVLDELRVLTTSVPAGEPVVLDLVVESLNEGVVAKGTISAPWVGECRRCLRPIEGRLSSEVMEIFEIEPVEGETSKLDYDRIDLEPLARETVLLELPQSPLCQDDCAGLCPECGTDLNAGDCGHTVAPVDDRWAALRDLKLDE